MTIPNPSNLPQFLYYLFTWKSAAKWFLENYSLEDFERDLAATIAADPSNKKFYIRNFATLSDADKNHELRMHYFINEVAHAHELLTSKVKFDKFFSVTVRKPTSVRTAAIATIEENLPLFYTWPEADGGGAYLVLSASEVIGLDSYQDNVSSIKEITTSKLAGLASTSYDVVDGDTMPAEISWLAAQRGITLPLHTTVLSTEDEDFNDESED